jgi:hypothetical protein
VKAVQIERETERVAEADDPLRSGKGVEDDLARIGYHMFIMFLFMFFLIKFLCFLFQMPPGNHNSVSAGLRCFSAERLRT